MPKPNGFSLTVIVLWVLLALSVVVAVAMPASAATQSGALLAMAKTIVIVSSLIGAAVGAVIILFYSKGENWARWVIMVMSVLYIIGLLLNLHYWALIPGKVVFSAVQAVFGGYLLWYLNTPPVKGWFEKKLLA